MMQSVLQTANCCAVLIPHHSEVADYSPVQGGQVVLMWMFCLLKPTEAAQMIIEIIILDWFQSCGAVLRVYSPVRCIAEVSN